MSHFTSDTSNVTDLAVLKKIQFFSELKAGWHHGEGAEFSKDQINGASKVAGFVFALAGEEMDAFPGLDGEIMVTAYSKNMCFEVIVIDEDHFTLLVEDEDGSELYEAECESFHELNEKLFLVWKKHIWNISDSSQSGTMTSIGRDLSVSHLPTPKEEVSPSLIIDAQQGIHVGHVSISNPFITDYQPNLRFFGNSQEKLSKVKRLVLN